MLKVIVVVLTYVTYGVGAYLYTRPMLKDIRKRKAANEPGWYSTSRWVGIIWLFAAILAAFTSLAVLNSGE